MGLRFAFETKGDTNTTLRDARRLLTVPHSPIPNLESYTSRVASGERTI